MDFTSLFKLLEGGISPTILFAFLTYGIAVLWKRTKEVEDKRDKDSVEREATVTIALEAVTHSLESFGEEVKAIRISLGKQNDKDKNKKQD